MDIKEIVSDVTPVPVVHPPVADSHQAPVAEETPKDGTQASAIAALRPVLKIDSDGLALLQFQDIKTGDVIFQVPSEEATRQYRERDGQEGTGNAPVEHMAASASGAVGAAAAAIVPPQPPTAPQAARDVVSVQAVKPVEPQSGSKQSNSVSVKA